MADGQNYWSTPEGANSIRTVYQQHQNDPKYISDAMRQYGVSNNDFMSATGMNQSGLNQYFSPVFGTPGLDTSTLDKFKDVPRIDRSVNRLDSPDRLNAEQASADFYRQNQDYVDPATGRKIVKDPESDKYYAWYDKEDPRFSKSVSTYDKEGKYTGEQELGLGSPLLALLPLALGLGAAAFLPGGSLMGGLGAATGAAGDAVLPGALGANGVNMASVLPGLESYLAPAAGAATSAGTVAKAGSGLASTLSNPIAKVATGLASVLGGGGSSSSSNGSSGNGGFSLGDILGLVAGGVDANKQGEAAKKMKEWMDQRQAMVDNLYAPGSPEYNALWEEMSRKDAAAGRNSQYGPRSVDLAAKIAQIKADQNVRMTTGLSRAYAEALNQDASKYGGLSAAAQKLLTGNGGGGTVQNLSSIINSIAKSGVADTGFGSVPGGYVDPSTGTHYNNPSAYTAPGYDYNGDPIDSYLGDGSYDNLFDWF
jgi:hypothetical protein